MCPITSTYFSIAHHIVPLGSAASTRQYAASFGGSMWESNPPKKLLTPRTGFEDQRAHQHPSTPINRLHINIKNSFFLYFVSKLLKICSHMIKCPIFETVTKMGHESMPDGRMKQSNTQQPHTFILHVFSENCLFGYWDSCSFDRLFAKLNSCLEFIFFGKVGITSRMRNRYSSIDPVCSY